MNLRMRSFASLWVFFSTSFVFATTDVPVAWVRTADSLVPNSYELVLAPQYVFSGASYLSTELRYQPSSDLSVGFGFGSGEIGYNAGIHGTWHILPDLDRQPALSLLGGLYFNHLLSENYFVIKVAPTLSETYQVSFGQLTPYVALQLSPAFSVSGAGNQLALRATGGTQIGISSLRGLTLWLEVGLNIAESFNQMAFGLSYPFSDFGS